MKISIFGTGYVGLVTGACLAELGHSVLCMDVDAPKINLLQQGTVPFYEPGLPDLVLNNIKKGRLRFITNAEEAVTSAEVIFNCVGTPSNGDGSANLEYIFAIVDAVARYATTAQILITKSTVPPGTARQCQAKLTAVGSAVKVVSNPEFLKEGNAVYDFMHPDRIVIGAQDATAFAMVNQVYAGLNRPYLPIVETDWETSEMIKYANNSMLATKISFINEIAQICNRVGADVKVVSKSIGMDYRISPKFLNAGIGYGGSCFPKDVRALVQTARLKGYEARLLQEVDAVNKRQKLYFKSGVHTLFGENLRGHTFTLWGASFKPKTNDLREAPSLTLIAYLLEGGAQLKVYDPVALKDLRNIYGEQIRYCDTLESSVAGSEAIFLVTEWDEFRNLDFEVLGNLMKRKVMFDGRNIYDPGLLRAAGFEYYGVGRA